MALVFSFENSRFRLVPSDHPHQRAWRAGTARTMPVPVLLDCDAPPKPRPYARALLDQIVVELARHGIAPSPLAVLASATDRGVSDETAYELAALLKLQRKEEDHAPRRKTAGGISMRTF